MHEHDVGHEHGHDAEGWESCTYGDIGVAGLAVFEQDLVNLWKRKSMKSFVNLGLSSPARCTRAHAACCSDSAPRLKVFISMYYFQSALHIPSHAEMVITVVTCIE